MTKEAHEEDGTLEKYYDVENGAHSLFASSHHEEIYLHHVDNKVFCMRQYEKYGDSYYLRQAHKYRKLACKKAGAIKRLVRKHRIRWY